MADTLKVSVISPERVLFEGSARGVIAPAFDGEMGILPARPLMTLLGVDLAGGTSRREAYGRRRVLRCRRHGASNGAGYRG